MGVKGTLNNPSDEDEGWCVEIGFRWKELAKYNSGPDRTTPPSLEDIWRVNFSRVQWEHEVEDGNYVRVPPTAPTFPLVSTPKISNTQRTTGYGAHREVSTCTSQNAGGKVMFVR